MGSKIFVADDLIITEFLLYLAVIEEVVEFDLLDLILSCIDLSVGWHVVGTVGQFDNSTAQVFGMEGVGGLWQVETMPQDDGFEVGKGEWITEKLLKIVDFLGIILFLKTVDNLHRVGCDKQSAYFYANAKIGV